MAQRRTRPANLEPPPALLRLLSAWDDVALDLDAVRRRMSDLRSFVAQSGPAGLAEVRDVVVEAHQQLATILARLTVLGAIPSQLQDPRGWN